MQKTGNHIKPIFFSDIVRWFNVMNVDYKLPPQFIDYLNALRDPRVGQYSCHKFRRDEALEYLHRILPHCKEFQINKLVSDCDKDYVKCTNRELKQLNTKLSRNNEFQSMCNKRRKLFGRTDKSFFFYTPSLFVDNCVHTFRLQKSASVFDHEVLYDKNTYEISHSFITRFPNSYSDGKLHGECKTDINKCMFAKEAIQYAKRHWKLFVLPPFSTDTVMFADPRELMACGGAPVIYCVYAIKEPNPHFQCSHTLQNIGMTLERHIVDEIRGGGSSGMGSVSYCMHCAGMLGRDSCINCGIEFNEEAFLCYGDGTLVQKEVIQFVKERETDIKTKYEIVSEEPILTAITEEKHQQNKQKLELKRKAERLEHETQKMCMYKFSSRKSDHINSTMSWLEKLNEDIYKKHDIVDSMSNFKPETTINKMLFGIISKYDKIDD